MSEFEFKLPVRIYLQGDEDEVTWCGHRINKTDEEYVRADIHEKLLERAAEMEEAQQQIANPLNWDDDYRAFCIDVSQKALKTEHQP